MIDFEHVSKRYAIGASTASLRERLAALPRLALSRTVRDYSSARYHWALQDVSFSASRGEALGIVGRNGAGKTTILKLLSRITKPTTGRVAMNGRGAALIELGAGFHPDLSGSDNVYLYGAILGLTRRQIDRKIQSIVDFAELADFIDTPVKRYSSGMYARLAFAVAAHCEPDSLLVDEVLAVGDRNFQNKCFEFLRSFVKSGNTTVFVSHDLWAVEHLCERLIWLDQGRVRASGEPARVLEQYLSFLEERAVQRLEAPPLGGDRLQVLRVRVGGCEAAEQLVFRPGEDLVLSIDFRAERPLKRPHFCVKVSDSASFDALFAANMMVDGGAPDLIHGEGTIQCAFKSIPLMPRTYHVWIEAWGADRLEVLCRWRRVASFRVVDPELFDNFDSSRKGLVHFARTDAPIIVRYEWRMPAASPPAPESLSNVAG